MYEVQNSHICGDTFKLVSAEKQWVQRGVITWLPTFTDPLDKPNQLGIGSIFRDTICFRRVVSS